MIRPFTVLCLLAACGSGLYLYSEKHRTELLDREIGRVIHATEAAQARTGMLRAEWAVLNEPGRLEEMAGRYLTLHPMAPTQFVSMTDLPARLPAPVAAPPGGSADDDEDAAPAAPSPAQSVAAGGPNGAVPPPPDAAIEHPMVEAAVPKSEPKPSPSKLVASAAAHPRQPHHVVLADRMEHPAHDGLMRGTPLPLAAPQPMAARVYSAMAHPTRLAQPRPAIVAAAPSYAPARPFVASALGGGPALPPPIPYGR